MNNKQLSEHFYGVDAPKRCPRCQAVWPANARFCGYDGEKLICNSTEKTNQAPDHDHESNAVLK